MQLGQAEIHSVNVPIMLLLIVGTIVVLIVIFAAAATLLLARRSQRRAEQRQRADRTAPGTDPWEESARRMTDIDG